MARHEPTTRMLADALLDAAMSSGSMEVVGQYALPLFLHTLALVLGRPQSEVARWSTWGIQALAAATDDGRRGQHRPERLHRRRRRRRDRGTGGRPVRRPRPAAVDGRALTRDEMRGIRQPRLRRWPPDGGVCAHQRDPPPRHRSRPHFAHLARDPSRIPAAIEEFLRFMTPITHLGRTATCDVDIGRQAVPARRAGLDLLRHRPTATRPRSTTPTSSVSTGAPTGTWRSATDRTRASARPWPAMCCRVALEQLVARCVTLELVDAAARDDVYGDLRVRLGYDRLVIVLPIRRQTSGALAAKTPADGHQQHSGRGCDSMVT